ncbi:ROK family protein [Patescibacteria group bacterium]|nr:ROK family protein [Patescibacteria group bacterium]MBU1682441.1 ROK family protein [Patescibacteria group bacterium]MBU1934442.1 ROK family protein [Patescibacteria group bacterium]
MPKQIKYIGVDVGGTKILLQTFDDKLNQIEETKIKTNTKSHAHFMKSIYDLIDFFFKKSVKGIGIAVPGIVDINKGVLVHAPHLPSKRNTPIGQLLKKRYGVKVHVDNDINAFLAAEHARPHLKKFKNIVAVMVGTGVGGAVFVNDNLMYGKNGFAGEVGHMIIDKCSPLKTFEENTSGHYVPKIAKLINPNLKSKITAPMLEEMLKAKSMSAKKIQNHLVNSLATGLSNLNLVFNPEVIVLGGSIYHKYLSSKKKEIERIIKKNSLDKTSPKLIDAKSTTSVCKGTVLLLNAE